MGDENLPSSWFWFFCLCAFTVLPDLCGCEIFNRFPFSDSHEDIDYSSYSLSLSLSHSATSLTQFLFRDFCFF
ncbi:hypothetical protein DEO72_LG1g1565 [Vigna unguiculata]|uniref:Secreted protein n=1 Tax=Vigna unguiculata TaxID=3917 RepID=A0A4D6KQH7_VIGUN|nr:hypothetical protein DEO72_LG1g1565 [Vigna unguiculata]